MSDEVIQDIEVTEPTDSAVRLPDMIVLDDRYKSIMSAELVDIDEYISDNSLPLIDCQYHSRYHYLHEQLNMIIERLNQMDTLLAAIARNTQAISVSKTTIN